MPDETLQPTQALTPPTRESVKMTEAPPREPDEAPAERTFERKATRLRLDDDERDRLARLLNDVLDDIKREREAGDWESNWDLWEDHYFGVLQDRPAGQAAVHVPISQEVVDTTLAVLHRALFESRPWLQVQPREPMDVRQAKRKERWLDYATTVEMQAPEKLDPVLFEAAALGTGVCYLPWLRENERIRDEEEYDGLSQADLERFVQRYPDANKDFPEIVAKLKKGQKVTLTVEYTEARQDAPEPTYIPLRDFRVRPTARWYALHRERYVGHVYALRYAQIEELVDAGYYDQILSRLAFKWDDGTGAYVDDPAWRDKSYELEIGVLRWRRGNDQRERRYLVEFHRESRTIMRILSYPYWHNRPNYITFYLQRSTRYIYGIGLLQKVEHSQYEVNGAHSLVLDHLSFSLPMYKARKGTEANFNPMRDGMYAGKVWYFDNPESDAQQFQSQVSSGVNVALNLEDRAARHAELASGASQNLTGLESSRDPNAPGNKTMVLVQQALVRVGRYLKTLAPSFSEFGFQVCELYAQFSPSGRQYRVMGPDGYPVFETISRQELRLRADYWPHTSTTALNPEQEKKDIFEMGTLLLTKVPEVQQSPLKRLAVLEMMLDAAGDVWANNKHKVLPGEQEMAVLRQQEEQRLTAPPPAPAGPPGMPPNGNGAGVPPDVAALLQARMGGMG